MDHAFGRGPSYALGMEEELLLVDARDHRLAPVASELIPRARADAGEVKFDVYEALVETATPVVTDAVAGARRLDALRGSLREAGATLLGAGIHPDGAFGDVEHVD